jgi:uncharacterized protein YdbL (DUF1318 family)
MRNRFTLFSPALLLLAVIGCTLTTRHTIDAHITVDIRHIEQQAENVLDYVEGKSDSLPGLEADAPQSSLLQRMTAPFHFTQVAYAAELKETSSPLVAQIATEMRKRFDELQVLRQQKIIGENNRGYVEVRPVEMETEQKNEAQRLTAAENADRKALYGEVARLNKADNVSVSTVEQIYHIERLNRAKSGESFQLPDAGPAFDDLKATALGKKLGSAAQPGAWVVIP